MSKYFEKKLSEYSRESELRHLITDDIFLGYCLLTPAELAADYDDAEIDQARATLRYLTDRVETLQNPTVFELVDYDVAIRFEEQRIARLQQAEAA